MSPREKRSARDVALDALMQVDKANAWSDEALRRLIAQCAAKRGLNTQVLYQGFQGPDHPIHPSMPETAYLKVFILRVWKG